MNSLCRLLLVATAVASSCCSLPEAVSAWRPGVRRGPRLPGSAPAKWGRICVPEKHSGASKVLCPWGVAAPAGKCAAPRVAFSTPPTTTRLCPLIPPGLEGAYHVLGEAPPLEDMEKLFPQLLPGGAWRPSTCRARHRVAVIIPYRDRAAHLRTLLHALHPFLQRQQLDYRIVVVEQAGTRDFNRGMLMNVGFVEALNLYDFQCFIFHDVDLIPENDRNLYTCPQQPRHMSAAINVHEYKLPYKDIFGGVSALTKTQFLQVNGFSNAFWGWGGEDNDLRNRIAIHGFRLTRYSSAVGRYTMLKHSKATPNPKRYGILKSGSIRYGTDGLNSLRYVCQELNLFHLYTHVLVQLE